MLPQPIFIPQTPGIYLFKRGKTAIYIGKASNLKKRLLFYWRKNPSHKIRHLLNETTSLNWIETVSEVDALLKESELIKKQQPKYNILMRDDKNYFYVGVTKEEFPKIFITHQPTVPSLRAKRSNLKRTGLLRRSAPRPVRNDISNGASNDETHYIGPFTSGIALKTTLRMLRKIFPYCTCKKPHKRSCLNTEIGRCPGYCCILSGASLRASERSEAISGDRVASFTMTYGGNISNIIAVLSSGRKKLLVELKKRMREAAQKQDFEKAAKLRDQIAGLENILSHRLLFEVRLQTIQTGRRTSPTGQWNRIERNIKSLFSTNKKISRVEGYDISNISGTEATGSRVVFINGYPVKSEYKKFRIKTVYQPNDVDMLKEVIRRRIRHKEWNLPDLMLIDGGKPQLNAVASVIRHRIFLAGLAKKEEELYLIGRAKPIRLDTLPVNTAFFFQRVRDESHRFAKKYHHKLRKIMYRTNYLGRDI